MHGVPLEDCTCGLQEPHIHAHVQTDSCSRDDTGDSSTKKKQKRADWRFLSQITLHLDEDEVHNYVPINPSMPKECNSYLVESHFQEKGLTWATARDCCDPTPNDCQRHRKYKMDHDGHTDYLVHNEETGGLHLEHPCGDCGENDIHGRFSFLHTRKWLDGTTARKKDIKEFRLHFFQEPHAEPFRLIDVLSHLFELESGRVHAVRVVDELLIKRRPSTVSTVEAKKQEGRSHLFVEKICCASETRQIQSLLKVKGVTDVSVNTTTKMVYVDHDPKEISADDIAAILNELKLGARVKKDCSVELATLTGIPTNVIVLSKFRITSELRMAETAVSTIATIEACLRDRFPNEGIAKVWIDSNSSTDILVVEHNPYFLTAKSIASFLNEFDYNISIECDGGADGLWALATLKSDVDDTIELHKSTVRPTVILSGVFWVVSMLSLIGENWDYLKYVALLSVAFGLPPIALKACMTLRRFHFDVNCMMLFAVLGALALQEFTEAAAVTFLFAISEALESKCTSRARNALASIINLRPENANVINPITQEVCVLPATAVAVGSLVKIKPGDKVPTDGVVIEGKSTLDESSLTGESRPVFKYTSMQVSGGTANCGSGVLVVRTTATSDDSAVSRLIRLVEEAQINRSDTEKMVDIFAKVYTPFVVLGTISVMYRWKKV